MTNESDFSAQADLGKALRSTYERKIMSTKTLRKRIALVAVAALGFGGISAVSASAGNNAAILFSSINLTKYTTTPTTGTAVKINMGEKTVAGVTPGATDTTNFSAYLSSFPTGGSTLATVTYATCADGATAPTKPTGLGGAFAGTGTPTLSLTGTAGGATATTGVAVTSSSTACTAVWSFTPSVAGTYVLTVFADSNADGVFQNTEVSQTISITVVAAAGWSQGLSTMYLGTGTTIPASASGAEVYGATAVKTIQTRVGTVLVSLKNSSNAAYAGQTVTATMSGSGFVACDTAAAATDLDTQAHYTAAVPAYAATRTATVTSAAEVNGYVICSIYADGTAGTGTVTISVTDQVSGATATLGQKSVTFTGNVTALKLVKAYYTIGRAGGYDTGKYATMGTRNAAAKIPAFTIKAVDAKGNLVPSLVLTGTTTDTAVAAGATCTEDDGSDVDYSTGGPGYFNCYFTTATSSASGNKATVGMKILDPADATNTTYITLAYPITIGGSVAKEVLSTDKASYAPGEAMTIKITATDSKGNPVYDGAASATPVTASKAVGGVALANALLGVYVGGVDDSDNSLGVKQVFAPAALGDFSLNATGTDASYTALTATAKVADAAAATAAASAQAATDAAIASLIAKINALSKLIAKIQKKLGVK